MNLARFKLLYFFTILYICNAERRNKGYYRAAVHEHKQYDSKTSSEKEIISKNLKMYDRVAVVAKRNDVDIIVFPEKGMFPMKKLFPIWFLPYSENIPHGTKRANPCNEENKFSRRPILRNLSCIAQKYNFYVVATLIDVKKCQVHGKCQDRPNKNNCVTNKLDCPVKGFFYFNTLVVFNRRGELIVRYYKRNPFIPLELGISTPKYPEPGYFDTEFGLSSTAIGFDLLFNDSIIDIERRPRTTGISYGNWWFDHTPFFLFSVPIQQAWSITNNVTILSSDVHNPSLGSLGSGIYLPGKGAVIYSYNPDGKSKLLISNVPTLFSDASLTKESLNTKFLYIEDNGSVNELNGEEPRDFKEECGENVLGMTPSSLTDYRCKQTEVEQYTFVKLNETEDFINVCSNGFCCSLEYKADFMDETFYFAVSGYPLKLYQIYSLGLQSCFLARCEEVGGQPCRNFLLKSHTRFRSIKMTCNFATKHIYPHLLDSELRLTDKKEWRFDGKSQLSYESFKGKNLMYADLHGRDYSKDKLSTAGEVLETFKEAI